MFIAPYHSNLFHAIFPLRCWQKLEKKIIVSVQSRVDSVNRIGLTHMTAHGWNWTRVYRIRGGQKERWLRGQLPVQRRRPTGRVWETNVIQGHLCHRVLRRHQSAGTSLHRTFILLSTYMLKAKVGQWLRPIRLPGCFPQHPPPWMLPRDSAILNQGFHFSETRVWDVRQCYGAEREEREEKRVLLILPCPSLPRCVCLCVCGGGCLSLNSFNLQSPQGPCLLCHRAPVKHPSLGWFSHCSHGQPATSCPLACLCSLHGLTFSSIWHYCSLSGLWNVSPAAEDVQSKGGRYQKVQQLQAELAGETKDSDIDFGTQGTVENPCCPSPMTTLGPACG